MMVGQRHEDVPQDGGVTAKGEPSSALLSNHCCRPCALQKVDRHSLDRSNCVYSPFEGDYTTIKTVKETSTVIESHMGQ